MPLDDPEDIGYNAGTGGDFTVNGVMARSGRGPNQYNVAASTFDGTADYVQGTGLSLGSNNKLMTFSTNIRLQNEFSTMLILQDASITENYPRVIISYQNGGTGRFDVVIFDPSINIVVNFQIQEAGSEIVTNKQYSLQIAVDCSDTAKTRVKLNGNDATLTTNTVNNLAIPHGSFSVASVGRGMNTGAGIFNGHYSETWWDNSYIDLTTENPFYDTETNKPKYLGASGELPTGSSPLIYLPLRGNDAGNNLGTAGSFTAISGPFTGARGASEFIGRSAKFSSGKYLNKSGALTGAASNVKTFTFALAFQWDTATSSYLFRTVSGEGITTLGSTLFRVVLDGPGGAMDARVTVSSSTSIWQTMLFSVDLADTGKRHVYVNGVSASVTWTSYPSTTYDCLLDASFGIGASPVGGDPFTGDLSFLYISQEYIDFSQEANRLKFFAAFNYPVDLGEDGSNPTGNQPVIYINNNFETGVNSGSGGNFVPQGALPAGPDVGS